MKYLPLLFCVACFGRGHYLPEPARAADKDAKLVDWIWRTPMPSRWQASAWFRPGYDIITPARVVVSVDDYACLMGEEVDEPQAREYYACPTGWRYPQRRSWR